MSAYHPHMTRFAPLALLFLLALGLTACGGSADNSPAPEPVEPGRCKIDYAYSPKDLCPTTEFSVVFCTAPIPNPGGIECAPPKGRLPEYATDPSILSDTWCCK